MTRAATARSPGRQVTEPVGEGPGAGLQLVGGHALLVDRDEPQGAARGDGGDDLHDDVRGDVLPLEALADGQADGDGRVEVPAGDVTHPVGHGHHGEAEGEADTEEADAEADAAVVGLGEELGGEHGTAAAAEHQHERAEELCAEAPGQGHGWTSGDGGPDRARWGNGTCRRATCA
jgi:hypothetical protein